MITRRFIQLCIYLLVRSSFIWSTGNCSIGDSASSQVVDSPNPSSISRNDKAFSPTKQYLMQSYYDRYTSLHDSDFENFISQEVTSSLCEVLPENHNSVLRLSVLRRDLVGEGSHRRVSTLIKLQTQQLKSLSELLSYSCEFIVIERLPSGVFADPFELQHLAQRGVFNDIAVFGDTNLELPSFLSNRSAVEIHLDVDPTTLLQPTDFSIEFPLHARYQPLNESGYSIVEFGAPDMLLRCSTKEKAQNSNCLFKLKNDDGNLYNVGLVWRIPSGKKAHSDLVSTVTFLIAFLSALVILVTSLHYFNSRVRKDLKQS
ncbi:phosphatidylinositol-glycan biosynthesis class X protein-like [Trifolium pratense]|uniref:phosphatidylinositol-glycan biosynthesis class X protein-like n=1 Tax=Trifolium pratense TaxID=57577 RepID=UPI001E692873|nr:phosphatidylinositol-glycan biosynthesis class X protein-like [Trifolium pratense]XP_045827325.1 phosphatidylinositol-glycan biosynthesis class X protein-like [Trifolium pratense]XP_045827326.1 phosphatidylinositol-glycan biosynthesis class X protein-like [Trifolium pratense]XP_045827327.1 phosphatidylinositol-glycan biosynthesis class X protein-like [Trifolium pratense]XP_045827328.1 phosphatidylinositol-glycan biosynthesis class X protein-like [Trifolium pratense]